MAKNSSQVRAQNKKTLVKRIRSRWQLYLLLLLPLAWLIIFAYVPMGGLVIAFKKYNVRQGIWGSEWVGLKNFEKFFKSVKFPVVMRNTLTISRLALKDLPLPGVPKNRPLGFFRFFRLAIIRLLERALRP